MKNTRFSSFSFFLKGSIFTFLGALISLLTTVFLAKHSQIEVFGSYTYLIAIGTLMAVPLQIGIPTVLVKNIPHFLKDDKFDVINGLLIWGLASCSLVYILGLSIFLILVKFGLLSYQEGDSALIVLIPMMAFTTVMLSLLKGIQYNLVANFLDKFLRPCINLAGILIAIYWLKRADLMSFLWIYTSSFFAILIIGLIYSCKNYLIANLKFGSTYYYATWFKQVIPFSFVTGLTSINNNVAITIIEAFFSREIVAYYKVAQQFVSFIFLPISSVSSLIESKISLLFAKKDFSNLSKMLNQATLFTLVLSLVSVIMFALLGRIVISYAFKEGYQFSYLLVFCLCVFQITGISKGYASLALNMSGLEKLNAYLGFSSVIVNILFMFFSAKYGTIYYFAVFSNIGYFLWKVIGAKYYYKHYKIKVGLW